MTDQPAAGRLQRLGELLAHIFPNRPLAVVAVVGIAVEAFLLSRSTDNVYTAGGVTPLLALVFVAWFWVTLTWTVSGVSRAYHRLASDWSRVRRAAVCGSLAVGAVLLVLAYIASWVMFLQTGRFANFEVANFCVANFANLCIYIREAEPIHLVMLGMCVVLLTVALPLLMVLARRGHWGHKPHPRRVLIAWGALTFAVVALRVPILNDIISHRRITRMNTLAHCLNPVVTLFSSGLDSLITEPIPACLEPSELVAIDSLDWAPPPASGKQPPSIVLVAVESLRQDTIHLVHQGREVLPHVNALAKGGVHFTRAYAQSTHSDYADICIVSSLYPLRTRWHHYYRKGDPWPRTLVYDLLKQGGYATGTISSQNEVWGGMHNFLVSPHLDTFYHPESAEGLARAKHITTEVSMRDPGFAQNVLQGNLVAGKFPDAHTADVAIEWIKKQPKDRPLFLGMNLQSSHFPYLMPDEVERPFQPCELGPDVNFITYPEEETPSVRNAYYNAIHQCDRQIGRLVAALKEQGRLENTIFVVTGENGESFHENGGSVGHARNPVQPAVHIALVVHAPGRLAPRVESYPTEHVDLVPTLLGQLGWPQHPNFQGIDVLADERPPLAERLMFFHTNSPLSLTDTVLLAGRWKFIRDHLEQTEFLYDVVNDPGETTDMQGRHAALAARLRDVVSRWRDRQLAYYHYPAYYLSHFPPRPPALGAVDFAVDTRSEPTGPQPSVEDSADTVTDADPAS